MVTMEDIARQSGVTRQTVSAVLNNKSWVSEKTRQRIEQVIAKNNYSPNPHAKSLTGQPSRLIGVIVRDIRNPFFTQLIDAVEEMLTPEGYTILYINTRESHQNEVEAIRNLVAYRVDGVIITPVSGGPSLDHLWALSQQKKPFVSIEEIPGIKGNYITFDERRAGFLAAEHLIRKGHRRICFLRGPDSASSAEARLTGFKEALLTYNVKFDNSMIAEGGHRPEDGYRAARQLLTKGAMPGNDAEPFTALICFSDFVAIGAYKAAHELNVRIPEQLSVIGFDDIEISELLAPSLSTIHLPIDQLGRRLGEVLLENIARKKQEVEPVHELLEPQLIERDSVFDLTGQA